MEKAPNLINVYARDPNLVTPYLTSREPKAVELRFNQSEEFFLELEQPFTVPAIPIHHDVEITTPPPTYMKLLKQLLSQVVPLAPQVFEGLSYFFDPSEVLRPSFFQIYRVQEKNYLYLLRLDLMYRSNQGTILTPGTNDKTPEFSTNKLFVEADFIPLNSINLEAPHPALMIHQTISQTWIGQRGKGYHVQGIWIDIELTKFFTKLFLPQGKRSYPYYPFTCKYKTICHTPLDLSAEGRKIHLPRLVRAYQFLLPRLDPILEALKKDDFEIEMPLFVQMKKEVPAPWTEAWKNLKVTPFLNSFDMKEFRIEYH
jgi:hypothetical protein